MYVLYVYVKLHIRTSEVNTTRVLLIILVARSAFIIRPIATSIAETIAVGK